MQGDDVQETLQTVHRLGNLDLLGLASLEFLITGIADDDWLAVTGDDCKNVSAEKLRSGVERTCLVGRR